MRKEKIRPNDFKESERPSTRFKQVFDVLIHRFAELLRLSLLQALFFLPLGVSIIFFHLLILNAGSLSDAFTVFLFQSLSFLITIPLHLLGTMGSFYALRRILWAEGEYASSTFFVGLKENWKKALLAGILPGFASALALMGFYLFFVYLADSPVIAGLGITILGIFWMFGMMLTYHTLAQLCVYENPLGAMMKNSFLLLLSRFPINLGVLLLSPGIFLALCLIVPISAFIAVALMLLFSAFGHLFWMANCLSGFDKLINKEHFPSFYRKGLRQE